MFHRGIDMPLLDVSYVTPLSLYILITLGVSGVISLVMGQDDSGNLMRSMAMPMPGMGAAMGGPQAKNAKDVLMAEVAHLHIVNYEDGVTCCRDLWSRHVLGHQERPYQVLVDDTLAAAEERKRLAGALSAAAAAAGGASVGGAGPSSSSSTSSSLSADRGSSGVVHRPKKLAGGRRP